MAHFADLARYIGVLCSSGSRMIEIEAHKKEAAASGCWFAAVLSAAATSEPIDFSLFFDENS